MKHQIIQNAIKTPDGTILVSSHVHDFRQYEDANGKTYFVDGGTEYLRRTFTEDYEDLTVYSDDSFEQARKKLLRGGCGKNGDEEFKWTPLAEMSDEWIEAAIKYDKERGYIPSKYYNQELEYRKNMQKEQCPVIGMKFKIVGVDKTVYTIVDVSDEKVSIDTINGIIVMPKSTVEQIFQLELWVVVEETPETKPDLIGTKFVLSDSHIFSDSDSAEPKTVFTISGKESEDSVFVGWEGCENCTTYLISTVEEFFEEGYWIKVTVNEESNLSSAQTILFYTDDNVAMHPGDKWFYVNTSKMHLAPRKTGEMEYKGCQPAEILTFSTMEAANKYLLHNRRLISLEDVAEYIGKLSDLECLVKSRM